MAFEIRFKDESLERLETDARRDGAYAPGIGRTFRKRMQMIRCASDERDFCAMRSLKLERLKGKREHQFSMGLNDQWRLILELEVDNPQKTVYIVAIEDYH
jgi:proteic killer suppression protein